MKNKRRPTKKPAGANSIRKTIRKPCAAQLSPSTPTGRSPPCLTPSASTRRRRVKSPPDQPVLSEPIFYYPSTPIAKEKVRPLQQSLRSACYNLYALANLCSEANPNQPTPHAIEQNIKWIIGLISPHFETLAGLPFEKVETDTLLPIRVLRAVDCCGHCLIRSGDTFRAVAVLIDEANPCPLGCLHAEHLIQWGVLTLEDIYTSECT
jgi:hypothetical protein